MSADGGGVVDGPSSILSRLIYNMPGQRRDSITGRDRRRDSRSKSVFVPTWLMFISVLFML